MSSYTTLCTYSLCLLFRVHNLILLSQVLCFCIAARQLMQETWNDRTMHPFPNVYALTCSYHSISNAEGCCKGAVQLFQLPGWNPANSCCIDAPHWGQIPGKEYSWHPADWCPGDAGAIPRPGISSSIEDEFHATEFQKNCLMLQKEKKKLGYFFFTDSCWWNAI